MRLAVNNERLSRVEIADLTAAFQNGDNAAGWRLVEHVTGLITRECGKYARYYGVEADDLRSEALLTVFRALMRYSPGRCQLSTFVGVVLAKRLPRLARRLARQLLGKAEVQNDSDGLQSIPVESDCNRVERLFGELAEAVEVAQLDPVQIDALQMLADGLKQESLARKLRTLYPEAFHGVSKQNQSSFAQSLISDAIGELRTVLDVSPPPLEGATSEQVARLVCELAVKHPHYSADRITRRLIAMGARMSKATVHNHLAKCGLSVKNQRRDASLSGFDIA